MFRDCGPSGQRLMHSQSAKELNELLITDEFYVASVYTDATFDSSISVEVVRWASAWGRPGMQHAGPVDDVQSLQIVVSFGNPTATSLSYNGLYKRASTDLARHASVPARIFCRLPPSLVL